jgi:cytochrome c5
LHPHHYLTATKAKHFLPLQTKQEVMFTGMFHTHVFTAVLFLLIYLIKTILLLSNKYNVLESVTGRLKVPEMIISFLFLATGIYLWINSGAIDTWFYFKLIAVFAAIPLAVIGFKRKKKALAIVAVLLLIYAYGVSETKSYYFKKPDIQAQFAGADQEFLGKSIYESQCIGCHGTTGKAQLSGAKDMTVSDMGMDEVINIIKKGKNTMPAYGRMLTEQQTKAVAEYVVSLREEYKQ